MYGTLYVVSTPIGNLKDITLRALETLKSVDLIAAEDTRHTRKLLAHYDIHTPLTSYYEYNKSIKSQQIISALKNGKNVALVSDAGTPGIQDPGYRVINDAIKEEIPVTVIPGPTALIAALTLSGLPTDKFIFEGYLSNKTAARKKRLTELKTEKRTMIFYESTHRIKKMLADVLEVFGDIDITVTKELTKKFETVFQGTASQVAAKIDGVTEKGEFVVLIKGTASHS